MVQVKANTAMFAIKVNELPNQKASAIMNYLQIKRTAIEIQTELEFLFRNGMDGEHLIEHYHLNKDDKRLGINLLKAMAAERKKLMDLTRYENYESFVADYQVDKKAALERLFMENFNYGKLRHVPADIAELYQIHSDEIYSRFMKVVVSLTA